MRSVAPERAQTGGREANRRWKRIFRFAPHGPGRRTKADARIRPFSTKKTNIDVLFDTDQWISTLRHAIVVFDAFDMNMPIFDQNKGFSTDEA